jgi:hypothetical protein
MMQPWSLMLHNYDRVLFLLPTLPKKLKTKQQKTAAKALLAGSERRWMRRDV